MRLAGARLGLSLAGVLACALACALGGCGDTLEDLSATPKPIDADRVFGGLGETPGKFAYPRCIDHDQNTVWVIDKSARVQQLDPDTGACLTIWTMPEYELGKPTGFTVAPGPDEHGQWTDRLLYIADTHYHRVIVYRPPATPADEEHRTNNQQVEVARFGEYGNGPGQFYYPTDVLVLPAADGKRVERIYVSEYGGNDRVSVFDGSFKYQFSFGTMGDGHDPSKVEFNRPQGLALWTKSDGSRELVITDACNHRVGRFTLDGKLIAWIGSPDSSGKAPGAFVYPYGLSILSDGSALVTEFGSARVQRIDLASGKSLGLFGRPGAGKGELAGPWGVTVLNDRAFVLDSANSRVVRMNWK